MVATIRLIPVCALTSPTEILTHAVYNETQISLPMALLTTTATTQYQSPKHKSTARRVTNTSER